MNDLIERYLACWNETDPAARRKLIADTWAEDAVYVDPMADVRGHEAIDATIAALQAQFPGCAGTLTGPVDVHHRHARFSWAIAPAGAEPIVIGFDVAIADEDGRLAAVYGWLDKVPA